MARIGPPAMMPVPGMAARTRPGRRRSGRRCRDAACGPRAAARGSCCAWPARSPCGSPPALRAPCRRHSRRGPCRRRPRPGGKAEPPAALHHLGDAVDADQLLDQLAFLAVARLAVAVAAVRAGRSPPVCVPSRLLSEFQAALAGGIGQGLHPAMKQIGAAVEHDVLDPRRLGAARPSACRPPWRRRCRRRSSARPSVLRPARGGRQGTPGRVVDDLGIDMLDERNTESRAGLAARRSW